MPLGQRFSGPRRLLFLFTVVLSAIGVGLVFAAALPNGYAALCDRMIEQAQRAAAAHNQRATEAAAAATASVRSLFEQAVALAPDEAQAYLTMATFLSNAHEYDEAVTMFDAAEARLPPPAADGGRALEMVALSRRRAHYRKHSMLRDQAYKEGHGNVTKAVEECRRQLQYTTEPFRTQHELATLEAMLCETDAAACAQSHTHFRISSMSSFQHFQRTAIETLRQDTKMRCMHSHLHMGSWGHAGGGVTTGGRPTGPYPNNTRVEVFGSTGSGSADGDGDGVWMQSLSGSYDIIGPDGVVVPSPAAMLGGDCSLLVVSGDFYTPLHDNLGPFLMTPPQRWPPSAKRPRPAVLPAGDTVLTLVSQASNTFYHWMAEALPRLVAFVNTHPTGATEAKLLIAAAPLSGRGGGPRRLRLPSFVTATLELLNVPLNRVIIYDPTIGARKVATEGAALVAVTWAAQPCPPTRTPAGAADGGSPSDEKVMCAALPHPSVLRATRNAISAAARAKSTEHLPPQPYVLVIGRGKDTTSRGYNETALAEHIHAAVEISAIPARFGVDRIPIIPFVSENHTLASALTLFHGAALVVGVHGGALSNLIACAAAKTAVLEVGFAHTVAAQHYAHLARALGLRYARVGIDADPLSRALGAPAVNFSHAAVVAAAERLLIAQSPNKAQSSSSSDEL